jgi:hypothetical protein
MAASSNVQDCGEMHPHTKFQKFRRYGGHIKNAGVKKNAVFSIQQHKIGDCCIMFCDGRTHDKVKTIYLPTFFESADIISELILNHIFSPPI